MNTNLQEKLVKLVQPSLARGIYTVWYKESPKSEWTKFKDCNDIFDTLMMVSVVRELLPPTAVVKYF